MSNVFVILLKMSKMKNLKVKCLECNTQILLDNEYVDGDIVACICCGTEFEVKINDNNYILSKLELDGEDFGE